MKTGKNFNKILLVILCGLSVSAISHAKDYAAREDCGNAKVVEGLSCPNIKVKFQFSNCGLKNDPQLANSVVCENSKLIAKYENGNFKYEAQFEKIEDGWGAVTWKPLGPLKQWAVKETLNLPQKKEMTKKREVKKELVKETAKEVAKEPTKKVAKEISKEVEKENVGETPKDRTVASLPTVVLPPTPPVAEGKEVKSETNLKFSGFVDFWLKNYSRDSHAGVSGSPESGFGLEDGALYINYQKDSLSFMLDVPFRRYKNSDAGNNTNPNSSPNGNIVLGNDKAQAYVKYTSPYNFEVAFGQFDTIYGVEVNDSKDRYFSKTGLVYDYMLPVTHTGAMISYNYNGGYARFLAANPNNKGSLGDSSTGDNNYEYGAALGYSNDMLRGQVGYLVRPINKASGVGGGRRDLIDVTAGATLGKFSLDLEYSMLGDDSKNTLTPLDTTDKEANGIGFLALASYNLTDKWSLGLRFEHLENDPGQIGYLREDAYAVGGHFKWLPSLETRVELVQYRYQEVALPGQNLIDNRFEISNIFSF